MFHDGKSSYIILSVFCIPLLSFPPHFRMTIVLQFLCIWKWRQKWTHLPQLARKNLGDHPQLARNQKNDRRNLGAGGLQRACRRTGRHADFGWLRGDFPWEKDGNMVIRNSKHADLSLMMFGKSSNVTEGVSISMHFTYARTSSEKTLKIWPKRLRMKCLQANKKLQRQTSQCLMFCLCCFRLQRLFPLFLLMRIMTFNVYTMSSKQAMNLVSQNGFLRIVHFKDADDFIWFYNLLMYNDCYGLIMDIQSIDQQNVCESCLDNDPSYVHMIYRNILDR